MGCLVPLVFIGLLFAFGPLIGLLVCILLVLLVIAAGVLGQ